MKKTLLTIAAALALVSCSQDDLMPNDPEVLTNGKIGTNVFIPATSRGAALNSVDNLITSENGFDLISYYNLSDTYKAFMGTESDGIEFKHDGSAWDYAERNEIYFWQEVPEEATDMKFFAVSPTLSKLPENASYEIKVDTQTITYTVPDLVSEQVDLMYAQTDLDEEDYTSDQTAYINGVPLNFHHALSQVVFNARIADKEDTNSDDISDNVTVHIKSITVKNVHGSGTFDMAKASAILGENEYLDGDLNGMGYTNALWDCSESTSDASFSINTLDNNTSINWIEARPLTDGTVDENKNTALLLIPQTLTGLDLSGLGTNAANEEQFENLADQTGAYLEVNCRVEYARTDTTIAIVGDTEVTDSSEEDYYANLYIPISTIWQPGYKYIYTLIFSADSGDPVKATVTSVDEWNTTTDIDGEEEDDVEDSNPLLLNTNAEDMYIGDTVVIEQKNEAVAALLRTKSGSGLILESEDESIAEITEDGKIKAVAAGRTTVVVSCEGYDDAEVEINVLPTIQSTTLTSPIKVVKLDGGIYTMGKDYESEKDDEYDVLENAPGHSVNVSEFYMGQYEVSVSQYLEFLKANASCLTVTEIDGIKVVAYTYTQDEYTEHVPLCRLDQNNLTGTDVASLSVADEYKNLPVVCSWEGAELFAKSVGGYLPHEEEWEYAARGGVSAKQAWWQDILGYDGSDWFTLSEEQTVEQVKNNIAKYENFPVKYEDNDKEDPKYELRAIETTENGNNHGLYDVFGNVGEWCDNYYYDYITGLTNDADHVFRGQIPDLSYSDTSIGIHYFYGVAYRNINEDMMNKDDFYIGFRIAFASDYTGSNTSIQTVSSEE